MLRVWGFVYCCVYFIFTADTITDMWTWVFPYKCTHFPDLKGLPWSQKTTPQWSSNPPYSQVAHFLSPRKVILKFVPFVCKSW